MVLRSGLANSTLGGGPMGVGATAFTWQWSMVGILVHCEPFFVDPVGSGDRRRDQVLWSTKTVSIHCFNILFFKMSKI